MGRLPFELGLEGVDLLPRVVTLLAGLVTLSESLVALLVSHATFRVEPLRGLDQLIPLLAQPSDHRGIQARPFL
jgi:hypothetical protein